MFTLGTKAALSPRKVFSNLFEVMLPKPGRSHDLVRHALLIVLLLVGASRDVSADPETVEGLYLTKKSSSPLQSGGQQPNNGLNGNLGGAVAAGATAPQPPANKLKVREFHQAAIGYTRPGSHRRAFAKYLNDPARNTHFSQPQYPFQPQLRQPVPQPQFIPTVRQPESQIAPQVRPPQAQPRPQTPQQPPQLKPQWLNGVKFYPREQLPISQLHQISQQQQQQQHSWELLVQDYHHSIMLLSMKHLW